jgi:hypothetical protein
MDLGDGIVFAPDSVKACVFQPIVDGVSG